MASPSTELRLIDPVPFMALAGDLKKREFGALPKLQWIRIDALVVDPEYQRELGATGRKNIVRIAQQFEWAKFAPVVVAPIKGDRFAIVDGQHRTTAAAMRGIAKVPCQVIEADRRTQAAAFAAINANITEMSPMQVHAAKVAAGDAEAVRLMSLCKQAGVTILRYPVQSKNQKVGETMSVGMLYRMLAKFGDGVLIAALSCITHTRGGNPGLIRSQIVTALCVVLEAEPEWRESRKLLSAMGKLDLADAFKRACSEALPGSGGGITPNLVDIISEHLEGALSAKVA